MTVEWAIMAAPHMQYDGTNAAEIAAAMAAFWNAQGQSGWVGTVNHELAGTASITIAAPDNSPNTYNLVQGNRYTLSPSLGGMNVTPEDWEQQYIKLA